MDEPLINEMQFRKICKAASWKIEWPPEYFNQLDDEGYTIDKLADEVFKDLIEPQGYGFYNQSLPDIISRLQKQLPAITGIVGASTRCAAFSLRFHNPVPRYYTADLLHDGVYETFVYVNSITLIDRIIHFASDGRMTAIAIRGEYYKDNDSFQYVSYDFNLLVPSDIDYELLQPFEKVRTSWTNNDQTFLYNMDRATKTKYTVVPYFTKNYVPPLPDEEVGSIDVLMDGDQPDFCSLSVQPGQTLAEALQDTMRNKLGFRGHYKIADYIRLDDEDGGIPRVAVHVQVDGSDMSALGKKLSWQTIPDNVFSYYNLYTDIRIEQLSA